MSNSSIWPIQENPTGYHHSESEWIWVQLQWRGTPHSPPQVSSGVSSSECLILYYQNTRLGASYFFAEMQSILLLQQTEPRFLIQYISHLPHLNEKMQIYFFFNGIAPLKKDWLKIIKEKIINIKFTAMYVPCQKAKFVKFGFVRLSKGRAWVSYKKKMNCRKPKKVLYMYIWVCVCVCVLVFLHLYLRGIRCHSNTQTYQRLLG